TVKMYCNHILTNALDSVTKTLYVADTKIKSLFNRDTLICGPVNMIVISKGFNIDNEYRWNDNHFVYYRAIKNPGTYWLEVKERNGCVYRDTLLVANGEIPEPNLSVNYDVFCLNRSKSVQFKNHSKSKDSIDYYRWDFGDSIEYTTDTNVVLTHQFKKADTYPVLLRAQTKKGCYHDTFVFIEVLPAPKANFTFTVKDTCFGTNQIVLKNNTVINKNDHRRFKWTFSEGYNLSNNNPPGPRSYNSTGNYKVYLIYENTNGCIDTMVQNVSIVSDPVADFSVPSSIYCTLDTMPFNGTISTSVNKPLKYDWLFADNTTSTDSIAKKAFTTTGNTTIRLAVESPKGCKDTMIKTILVNEKPKVDFVVNKDTQCLYGHNFDFTNTTKFSAGSLNYTWNLSNNTSSTDSNLLNVKFAQDSTYKVKLSTTTSVGCYAEKVKNVYLGAYPKAGFTISKDKQCFRGNAFNFTNQSTFKNAGLKSTVWNFDNGDTSHKTSINAYKYLTEDTFDVKMIVVSSLGCMDTLTKRVIVFPQAKSLFTINNNVQCSKNQKFVFTNQSTVKSGNLNFKWDFGDNKTSTDTNYIKQYNVPAQYNVKLIVGTDNNCPDTSSQSVTVNVSPNSVYNISNDKQCFKGNSFSFTNSSNIPTGTINSTKWLMDDGNEYNTINVSNHVYTTEDTFNVKLISVSDRNCQDTMTKMAITFAQPVIDFDIPNDTQCWQKNRFVIVNKTKLKYGVLTSLWNFGDNTSSNKYNPTDKVYPNTSASYVISYKAISDHGCRDSATRNIALLERPVSDFSINDSIQCFKGHLFSFTNKTTFSVMSTLSYWWDYDNGDNSTGFAPKTAVYPVPDKYNVQLISFSSLTNCFDTTYKTVIPAPHANVKFTVDKDSQCFRSNRFHFMDASTLDFGNMNYKWDFGDNTSSVDTSPYKSYKQDRAYNIKLVLTTNYGCTDSAYSSIGFYPNPFAGFNINDTAQCLNAQSFDLTNTSTLISGVMTYDWWMDDNSTFNSKDVIGKQFATDDVHNIRLAVATDQGCTDTMSRTVYLERTGNSDILLLENDSQCYKGNRFDFNRNSNNSKVNFVSYKWLYDDGQEANVSDPAAMSYKKDGDYNVQMITVSANGCNDTITKRITVHPHPVTSFTTADVCFPEPVKFTNTSSISKGSIGASYWNTGDGGKYKQFEPTHTYANAGTFNVELITESNYGCKDTLLKPNAVKVKAKPIANFEFSGLPITTPNHTRLQFKNLSSANANKFNWDFGNSTNSTDRDPIGEYGDTGTYWVELVAYTDEGCSDTFKLNTGKLIPDFAYFLPSAFSPNGDIHNQIYKGFATTYTFKFKMEIFNRWGEKLWETDDITQGWDGFYNGELCMEGAYLCRVQIVPFKGYMRTYEQMFMLMR
ncbi:MAG TPA: PKD domain-containing protein, partial [Bacteroidia bacterium]